MVVNHNMFSRSMEMLVDSCWKHAGSMLRSEEDCWEINLVVNNKIRGTSYPQWWPGHHLGLRGLALQADRSWWRPEVELSGDGDESETQRMILHALQLRRGTWNWWAVRPLGNHVLILQLWAIVWPFCGSCKLSTILSRHLRVKFFVDCFHVFAIVGKASLSYHSSWGLQSCVELEVSGSFIHVG